LIDEKLVDLNSLEPDLCLKEKDDAPQEREKSVLEEICFLVDQVELAIKREKYPYLQFLRNKSNEYS